MLIMKKYLTIFGKTIGAGITAILILSVLFAFYSLLPVHHANPDGNTDYVWPANSHWIKMTEGMAWGTFDANGYNNAEVIENPDIVILGSSHMEATDVMQDQNTSAKLGQMLDGKYSVYNMGISEHNFQKICQLLPANLERYEQVPQVVVLETRGVKINMRWVRRILRQRVGYLESHDDGWIANLQRLPFVRLLYKQMQSGLLQVFLPDTEKQANVDSSEMDLTASAEVDSKAYRKLCKYLSQFQEQYQTNLVIIYHPTETILKNGKISYADDLKYKKGFKKACKKYGITFIDMTSRFRKMYRENYWLPHGFATGEIGTGHLNVHGHQAMAEALYDTIMKLEAEGKICR